MNLSLVFYLLTFGLAQMIFGPMSADIGRKRPMVIGVEIFIVATVAAYLAPQLAN